MLFVGHVNANKNVFVDHVRMDKTLFVGWL